jgi:hypothetical protein
MLLGHGSAASDSGLCKVTSRVLQSFLSLFLSLADGMPEEGRSKPSTLPLWLAVHVGEWFRTVSPLVVDVTFHGIRILRCQKESTTHIELFGCQ